ncbi:hypothetical protein, unknown function [Leishmania mexicana MHOM/GT/2001/U1103]|uniref:Uncharacterized protein n=1 Tax=Leishmania mexicana (strain MHOM/GT/2001/U1103) TaxID=929439 RepID=E9AX76_LEIMU|nr:hypothetical protein, unknown function [Leishmania mexicana MHOM/GT/2001/U1103]CBZ27563.1 hypothetical protein, unknown function [Leishmania mexicana MHOM/GT/2001/U1103]
MERYESIAGRAGFARSHVLPRGSGALSSASVCYENAANYLQHVRGADYATASRSFPANVWDALCQAEASVLRVGQLGEGRQRLMAYKGCTTSSRSGDLLSRLVSLEKSLDKLLSGFPQTAEELVTLDYNASLCSAGARSALAAVPSFVSITALLRTINERLCSLDDFSREVLPLMQCDDDVSHQCLLVASRLDRLEKKLSTIEELVAALGRTSAAINSIFERIGARYGDTTRAVAM